MDPAGPARRAPLEPARARVTRIVTTAAEGESALATWLRRVPRMAPRPELEYKSLVEKPLSHHRV
jgi:hypothetical protein